MLHWCWRWLPNILTLYSPSLLHTAAETEVEMHGLQEREREREINVIEGSSGLEYERVGNGGGDVQSVREIRRKRT